MANFPIAVIIGCLRRNFFNEGTGRDAENETLFCASPVTGRQETVDDVAANSPPASVLDWHRLTAGNQAASQTEMPCRQRMRDIRWKGNLN